MFTNDKFCVYACTCLLFDDENVGKKQMDTDILNKKKISYIKWKKRTFSVCTSIIFGHEKIGERSFFPDERTQSEEAMFKDISLLRCFFCLFNFTWDFFF